MKTIKLKELKERYEFVCNEYIRKFENKQCYDFEGWVADQIGGVAVFCGGQYFFSLDDIIYDINNKCSKGQIFEWMEYYIELPEGKKINYHSYSRGLRIN